jgi:hypothetical protein
MTITLLAPSIVSACEDHDHARVESLLISFANGLPLKQGTYIPAIERLVQLGIVDKYGTQEFEAHILANELHAHPGIYLVIGVKMGLFALELLEAPSKKLTVESECLEGTDYPLPCINDGITAATLCSMNHKMMNLAPGKPDYAATFTCKGRSLRVSPRHKY